MVKVISVSEEAYQILKHFKKGKASFSDVIKANLGEKTKEKTENLQDLVHWVKTLVPKGKKKAIHKNIDKIVYGVGK